MEANGDKNEDLLELEKNLLKERDPKKGLSIAKEIMGLIGGLKIEQRGKNPSPFRYPGKGTKGELWFRNRLLWLRTIPLEKDISFMITHSEPAVYYQGKGGRNSADLLGIWHSNKSTKLGVAELKAGKNGNHVLYAIMEGVRNTYLNRQACKRLYSGWSDAISHHLKKKGEGAFWANVWNKGNPFHDSLKKTHLIIIGDVEWINAQKEWQAESKKLIKDICKKFGYETSIYSLNKKAKPASKPYVLLPLDKWLL